MRYQDDGTISVIKRPKVKGAGEHWGVLFPGGVVVDCSEEAPFRKCSIEVFQQGFDITTVRVVPPHLHREVMRRLRLAQLSPRTYHQANWNCEVFANWLTCEKPKSSQVTAVSTVGLLLVLALIASN